MHILYRVIVITEINSVSGAHSSSWSWGLHVEPTCNSRFDLCATSSATSRITEFSFVNHKKSSDLRAVKLPRLFARDENSVKKWSLLSLCTVLLPVFTISNACPHFRSANCAKSLSRWRCTRIFCSVGFKDRGNPFLDRCHALQNFDSSCVETRVASEKGFPYLARQIKRSLSDLACVTLGAATGANKCNFARTADPRQRNAGEAHSIRNLNVDRKFGLH